MKGTHAMSDQSNPFTPRTPPSDGWHYQLEGDAFTITSTTDPQHQSVLSAQAAYALLDYLYQRRDELRRLVHGLDEPFLPNWTRDAVEEEPKG
jgi:hypothetical protein